MRTPEWNDQIIFTTHFRTLGRERVAVAIVDGVQAVHRLTSKSQASLALLGFMIACTNQIAFTLDETSSDGQRAFQKYWQWLRDVVISEDNTLTEDPAILAEIWSRFEEEVESIFGDLWFNAYAKAQSKYPAAKDIVNPALLSPAEKADETLKKKDAAPAP